MFNDQRPASQSRALISCRRGANTVPGRQKGLPGPAHNMCFILFWTDRLSILESFSVPNYKADLRQGVAVESVSCEPSTTAREIFDEDAATVEEAQ